MKYSRFLIALLYSSFLFSCEKNPDETQATPSLPAKSMSNVAYGSNSSQTMDVYLPANRTAETKVMILVHGGAWNAGDKAELDEYVDSFKRRMPEYAIFNVNYRLALTPSTLFPTQENDIKSAIQFINEHTAEYAISKKFVMTGVSAGAHLSLLQAYKHPSPIKLKAVISFFAPTDLIDMYRNPTNTLVPGALESVIGKTPTQDSLLYAHSSPVNFISPNSPPTLLLHGGVDPLVRASQSVAVQMKLQANSVVAQYVFYPNEGHGWFGARLSDSFDKIQAFLVANVQ